MLKTDGSNVMKKSKKLKQEMLAKQRKRVLAKKATKLALEKARDKAQKKGDKKLQKTLQTIEKKKIKAVINAEKKAIKQDDKKYRLRKCVKCGKERLGKNGQCFNCKINQLEKLVGYVKKGMDFLMKQLDKKKK